MSAKQTVLASTTNNNLSYNKPSYAYHKLKPQFLTRAVKLCTCSGTYLASWLPLQNHRGTGTKEDSSEGYHQTPVTYCACQEIVMWQSKARLHRQLQPRDSCQKVATQNTVPATVSFIPQHLKDFERTVGSWKTSWSFYSFRACLSWRFWPQQQFGSDLAGEVRPWQVV